MHLTSVARLRLDTIYCTTDWNEQYRRMHDNNWLLTLPFDVDYTGCHMPHKTYLQTGNIWTQWLPCFPSLYSIHTVASKPIYIPYKIFSGMLLIPQLLEFYRKFTTTTMETAEYWLMACKYTIWNAAITSLQFWAEDFNWITLGIASECIYTSFFWTPTSHTLCQLSEDVLFGHFVIALNAAFT